METAVWTKEQSFHLYPKQWDMLDNRMAQYVIAQKCQIVIHNRSNRPVVQTAVFQMVLV